MNNKGFTLIETVIVVLLISIVGAIGGFILLKSFQAAYYSRNLIDATWQGQVAMQRMSSELRELRSASSLDLDMSSNESITFNDITGAAISYFRSGNHLMRTGINQEYLADGITALHFNYYDNNDQLITEPAYVANVRCIGINLSVNKNKYSNNFQVVVCPRNLL